MSMINDESKQGVTNNNDGNKMHEVFKNSADVVN